MTTDLTIVCTMWKGWQPIYDASHVNAMGRMLDRFMPGTRFVCFTDWPTGIKYETAPLPPTPRLPMNGKRNCFRRMWYFSRECAGQFPGRLMNIDLDAIVLGDLRPLVTAHDFRILRAYVCPYNGGFWTHKTGTRTQVWNDLTPQNVRAMYRDRHARRWVGSDQRWLAYKIPGEATYDEADGVWYGHMPIKKPQPDHADARRLLAENRLLFFPGSPGVKPWSDTVKKVCPPMHEAYMEFYE
jgi:hypothetical protein